MKLSEAEARIRDLVVPGSTGILKCDGAERRRVTSNGAEKIGMRTGAATKHTKAIKYGIIRHAFEVRQTNCRFESGDFRLNFDAEYRATPCRYSMTGGVLVEVGAATLLPGQGEAGCYYVKPNVGVSA